MDTSVGGIKGVAHVFFHPRIYYQCTCNLSTSVPFSADLVGCTFSTDVTSERGCGRKHCNAS